jgi:hypothetical protein
LVLIWSLSESEEWVNRLWTLPNLVAIAIGGAG